MRFLFLAFLGFLLLAAPVAGQQAAPAGIERPDAFSMRGPVTGSLDLAAPDFGLRRQPRWVKAALIGGVAGGALFAAMHAMFSGWNAEPNSMAHDLAIGVFGGAAAAGGSMAFYDWVCAPGSASDDAGLCGQHMPPVMRSRDYTRSMPVNAR